MTVLLTNTIKNQYHQAKQICFVASGSISFGGIHTDVLRKRRERAVRVTKVTLPLTVCCVKMLTKFKTITPSINRGA